MKMTLLYITILTIGFASSIIYESKHKHNGKVEIGLVMIGLILIWIVLKWSENDLERMKGSM